MSLRALAQAPPSPDAWSALVAALDRKKPRASHASGLGRLLRDWPAWTRLFPAAWFQRVVAGESKPWYALAADVDVSRWANSLASAGQYRHEMRFGYELDDALRTFGKSSVMAHVRRIRTCEEGGECLLADAERLVAVELVSELRLETMQTLLDAAWTPSLGVLSVQNRDRGIPPGLWPRLAARLGKVRVLSLLWQQVEADFVYGLLDRPEVQPEVLELPGSIGSSGLDALIEARPRRLRQLGLRGRGPDAACFERLLQTRSLRSLRSLSVDGSNVGDALAHALAGSPILDGLEQLDLRRNALTADGVAALAASGRTARLRSLTLRNNSIVDAGAQAIAASPHLARLEHLNLRETRVGAEGFRALLRSETLPALRVVNIMHTPGSKRVRPELEARFERVIDL